MAALTILKWPDERLRKDCKAVEDIAAACKLADDMFETMYAANGRGLAAPQIGELIRLFVMDCTWKDGDKTPMVFINPEITTFGEEIIERQEACLSIPDVTSWIKRPSSITVAWTNAEGDPLEQAFEGVEATCIQHEVDHLNGIVTLDRVNAAVGDEIRAWLSE